MDLSWSDAEHTNIVVVLDEGEQLANVVGPATVSVPVDPGNADYQFIVNNFLPEDIGPPRAMTPRAAPQEREHGQRRKTPPSRHR